MPEDWGNDPVRCKQAGLPNENRAFKTKLELAVDIIHQQNQNGIWFDYTGGDGFYGNDADLARIIDQMGYIDMFDIHSDQKISLNQTELFLAKRKSTKGPAPQRLKTSTPAISVSEYMEKLLPKDWERFRYTIQPKESSPGSITSKNGLLLNCIRK